MKVVVAEGTPEELARYEHLTGWTQTPETVMSEDGGTISGLDVKIFEFLKDRAGTKKRFEIAENFVGAAMARGDIVAEPGSSKGSKDGYGNYLRLYRTGPRRFGAVVYYTPSTGVADLRLTREAAEGQPDVQVRYPERDGEYNIRVRIDSPQSVDLALQLLGEAVERIEE